VDADSTFVAYERSKLAAPLRSDDKRAAPGQGPAARTRTDVRQLQRAEFLRYQDPAAYLLALPSAGAAPRGKASASAAGGLPVFSEFAVDGVTGGWRRQKAGASGQVGRAMLYCAASCSRMLPIHRLFSHCPSTCRSSLPSCRTCSSTFSSRMLTGRGW
jgi:hypothetical protein